MKAPPNTSLKKQIPSNSQAMPSSTSLRRSAAAPGFTLVELLITIAIIAVLAALAFPVFSGMVRKGKTSTAISNVRQIGILTEQYQADSGGTLPSDLFGRDNTWIYVLWDLAYPNQEDGPDFTPDGAGQVMKGTIFHTPLQEKVSRNGRASRCFAWNGHLRSHFGHPRPYASRVTDSTRTILLSDTTNSSRITIDNNQINYRNDGKAIFLFVDGRVELLRPSQVPLVRDNVFWGGDDLSSLP